MTLLQITLLIGALITTIDGTWNYAYQYGSGLTNPAYTVFKPVYSPTQPNYVIMKPSYSALRAGLSVFKPVYKSTQYIADYIHPRSSYSGLRPGYGGHRPALMGAKYDSVFKRPKQHVSKRSAPGGAGNSGAHISDDRLYKRFDELFAMRVNPRLWHDYKLLNNRHRVQK